MTANPNAPEDDTTGAPLGDVAESQETDDSLVNSDLHGEAREVAEDAAGDGPAKTPGA